SSGGFTDCLLQNGASFVYAVDVGYGQLDWKLRNDERVKVIERTNIRYLSIEDLYQDSEFKPAVLTTADLSFISVNKVLPNILNLMGDQSAFIILIKPQFEAGKELVPKSGVVKDKNVHIEVIKNVLNDAFSVGLIMSHLTFSPVKGPSGNIEYLCYLTSNIDVTSVNIDDIIQVVNSAHQELN
ncbi:MAG: TlyA family RNA methyltransferase, partial [Vampirovibrionia bacterium]